MKKRLRSRVTYANVVATLALFVALGGSSYAAVSLTGQNIKDNTLTSSDVKNNSLTTNDIKDGSLLGKDFKAGQLPAGARGPAGATGAAGAAGATGATGAAGAAGAPGVSGYEIVTSGTFVSAVNHQDFGTVNCPAGKKALGGGVAVNATLQTEQSVASSYPTADGTGWTVYVNNTSGNTRNFAIRAVCAFVQ